MGLKPDGAEPHDPEPLEMLQPLGEQGAGEPGRALEDLTEGAAAQPQVADDQRCPALGEDLGTASDGAVLAVRAHGATVAPLPPAGKSTFLTAQPRSAVVR